MNRRTFLHSTALAAGTTLAATALAARPLSAAVPDESQPERNPVPTTFQLACMTLPYAQFPLQRALTGIKSAGYKYVAWGTSHREDVNDKKRTAVMASDATPAQAKQLGKRCRDVGLEPVMMFSGIYPEHKDAMTIFTNRIKQCQAASIEQLLTFGHTRGGNHALWVKRFKQLGPIAKDHNVTIVIKQHGGETGTGEACMKIAKEVNHPNVWVNFDAGNVMDYLNLDPIPDIQKCARYVRSFCIKDHRNFPKDQDCGPGYGVIDHYKLLHPVAHTGLTMPLAFENIFKPVVDRPTKPEGIDWLAKRAREYVETVIAGLGANIG